ncbi:unnamed protein product [Moneuplotes crassus]|uniref:Protein kinase domain-containing protein n=1 Tax=Euplotes crassus TaxID=5936 RepID=A0AAD1U2P6_EUPCR|nr:unnamed protein product [Moneuplotes crassus]
MGQIQALSSLNTKYDLQRPSTARPEAKHVDKHFNVVLEEGIIEEISIPDPDLTVGWLLSEVSRRYQHYARENGTKRAEEKVVVALKSAEFYPTLDTYLESLDNVIAPIKHNTTFDVHFAKLSDHQQNFIKMASVGPEDFEYLKVIGQGSYSHVVIARKKDSGKQYAVKVIKKKLFKEVGRETFISESEINKKFQDTPFVIDTYYAFQTEEEMFLVMELCPGGTLFDFLKRLPGSNRVNLDIVRFYIAEIIISLEFVHAQNVMYRDLKPENILIDLDGHIKLSDFGLSKALESRNQMSETFCGSPEYLAPEMVFGLKHTRSLDFYTLGCLAYEIIFGYPPYFSDNVENLGERLLKEKLYFPRGVNRNAKNLIKWLLEKDPDKRPLEFSEVKNHPFFEKVHWGKLAKREVAPPFVPDLYKVDFERCFLDIPINQALNMECLPVIIEGDEESVRIESSAKKNSNSKNYAKSMRLDRINRKVDIDLSKTVQKDKNPDWIDEFDFESHPESEIMNRNHLNLALRESLHRNEDAITKLNTIYSDNFEEFEDEMKNNNSCIILQRNMDFKFKDFKEENDIFFQETRYNSFLTTHTPRRMKRSLRQCKSADITLYLDQDIPLAEKVLKKPKNGVGE